MVHPLNIPHHAQEIWQLFQRIGLRFIQDRCLQRASALAYANLLAIVPMVILAFSIFASFQDMEDIAQRIQQHLVSLITSATYLANPPVYPCLASLVY